MEENDGDDVNCDGDANDDINGCDGGNDDGIMMVMMVFMMVITAVIRILLFNSNCCLYYIFKLWILTFVGQWRPQDIHDRHTWYGHKTIH